MTPKRTDTDLPLGRLLTGTRDDFTVPISLATQTVAVLARKGAGKTYTMKRIVESLLAAGVQVITIDAVGVWYGLRLDASGEKASRFTVPILGGWRGDIDLSPSSGALVASTLVESGQSAVLDVSKFRKGDRKTFATEFAEELLHLKKDPARRSPLFVVLEEAQLLAPQKVQKGEERMLGAFEDLVKLGRNYGIGVGMISQRPQSINKDILNQTELLIVLQTNGPQERKTIEGWILENDAAGVDLVAELPRLHTGEAFVWSPGWLRFFGKVKIDRCVTFDASATPTASTTGAGALKPIDLGALQVAMATVVEERQANDPKALKARIQVLEDQVAELEGVAVSHAAAADAAPALTAEDWHNASRFEAARAQIAAVGESLSSQVVELAERVREDLAVKTPKWHYRLMSGDIRFMSEMFRIISGALRLDVDRVRNRIRAAVEETLAAAVDRVAFVETVRKPDGAALGGLKRGARIMLEALATAPDYRLTRQALSTRAGIKMGGTFSDYLSALRTRGYIDETHGVALTDAGLAAIGPILPAPLTRAVVLARHASRLKAGARRMFDVLAHRAHKRAELAEKAGIAMGGTFSDYLSALRTAGLIDERDGVVSWSETFRALR